MVLDCLLVIGFFLSWGPFSLKNGVLAVSSLANAQMVLTHVPWVGKVNFEVLAMHSLD